MRILFFSASWCKPCQAIKPFVDNAAAAVSVPVEMIEWETSQDVVARYDVRGVPTLILEKDGEIVDYIHGAQIRGRLPAALGGL